MDNLSELKQWRDAMLNVGATQHYDLLDWCVQQIEAKQTSICPDCFYGPSCECADNETQSCNKFIAQQIERPAVTMIDYSSASREQLIEYAEAVTKRLIRAESKVRESK